MTRAKVTKTPNRDGTTHIVLEPLDLMARLAALVPPPRMHLKRCHGLFVPHSKLRAAVTPAGRGEASKTQAEDGAEPSSTRHHLAISWAQRLKHVFGVEIEACTRCGGKLRIIASIEEPAVIAKILSHLEKTAPEQYQIELTLGARVLPAQFPLLRVRRVGACPLAAAAAGWVGVCLVSPGSARGRGKFRVRAEIREPKRFLVAGFTGKGLTPEGAGIRGSLRKAGYTNRTCLRGLIEPRAW